MSGLAFVSDASAREGGARAAWASQIAAAWNKTRAGIIEVGRLLIEAKAALAHGEFEAMIRADLPFAANTAQILMKISRDERFSNPQHVEYLPNSWGTLYQLTFLDDAALAKGIESGAIRADMERKEAERLRQAPRRLERLARVERLARSPLAQGSPAELAALERRYPVIYADPPWKFETRSALGRFFQAERHYPTMTLDEIMALPVGGLAAADAALFLWATVPMLPEAQAVMTAWGFVYRSHLVWLKSAADGAQRRGTGFWFANCHELLLLGTRGEIPAPLPGRQEFSLVSAPVGRHSEKPERFRTMIEEYFPGVGWLELFARTGPAGAPAGWDLWGNEAAGQEAETADLSGADERGAP